MVSATGGGSSNVIVVPASAGNPEDGTTATEEKEGRRKRGTIFSVHVHPDGTRLATAGLDMKIKIWNTEPILNPDWEEDRKKHKLLATLARHTGSVLVVRWSNSGRYLASGSDDTIALIWEWDRTTQQFFPATAPSNSIGTAAAAAAAASLDGPSIENWRPVRRLAGHTSDVVDLAWAPSDLYLATVSLDSVVIVYNGRTFDRLRRIDGHAGFIKGVCFDPVGQYMATASDDKSLKVWRTADWTCHKTVTAPFEGSPSSTFFRRPSWSPDGAHILCANAMSGPVFVSSVVERESWSSDISLVGHENCVAVAAFSPNLFRGISDDGSSSHASLMALGSLDQSVSVWLTGLSKPLLVARDVFERQVMDLSWSANGLTLYACSADGSVAAFVFDAKEVSEPAPPAELARAKANWGYRPTAVQATMLSSSSQSMPTGTSGKPNLLTVRKGKGVNQSQAGERAGQNAGSDGKKSIRPAQENGDEHHDYGAGGIVIPSQKDGNNQCGDASMFGISPSDATPSKRRISSLEEDLEPLMRSNKRSKDTGKNLGSELAHRARALRRQLASGRFDDDEARPAEDPSGSDWRANTPYAKWLPSPPSMTCFTREQRNLTLECRNSSRSAEPSEIAMLQDGKICWVDWTPSVVTTGTCNEAFSAVALEDSSVVVHSSRGRRLGLLRLPSPCVQVESSSNVLMMLTADGLLRRIGYPELKELHPPMTIHNIIKSADDIEELWLQSNGVPVLICRTREEALVLDTALMSWVSVSSGFFADCSPFWESRLRGRDYSASRESLASSRDPVRNIEALVNQLVMKRPIEEGLLRYGEPKDVGHAAIFKTSCGLRHLEGRMQAAILLDSALEYKATLLAYAKKLSEDGVKNLAEDLIKSLLGPVYYKPDSTPSWNPHVLGYKKRELLAEVLAVLGKGRHLNALVCSYQEILRALQ
ncbi:WD40 repeat-like protein [Tilletiaria anomala UBC 951]|uniref:Protein HIR n=1 Tax=Tilletiaria anomala (strain ATCC 24038 / CBS 436.72 / UBC 951) TaxID=1037660 RepID=A0A066VNZ0_TILAU|nr:WD40 repeat-like protein [Tilletiaria anomala UBC 951]KDN43186.1 WD40 repeat-like protein [Tilletiaria anomala UBC 951]